MPAGTLCRRSGDAQIQVQVAKAVGGRAKRARGAFAAGFKPDSPGMHHCNGILESIQIIDVPTGQNVVVGKDRDGDNRHLRSHGPCGG